METLYNYDNFTHDDIRAIYAKTEAQRIAFSPLTFQAVHTLIECGILRAIEDAGEAGLTRAEAAKAGGISEYGAGVLCEMALGMGVLRLASGEKVTTDYTDYSINQEAEHFVLGKIGWMLLEDDLTRVNFNFVADVCYKGAEYLCESVRTGRPVGLRCFGDRWTTIYEALSSLPDKAKRSWFAFDHFYSDIAFPESLPIVFDKQEYDSKVYTMVDIGGNTAKWAIAAARYDTNVKVTIVDLPGQTSVAERNIAEAGLDRRIYTQPCNVLSAETKLPAADIYWMSQFLDCFSLHQVTNILSKVREVAGCESRVYVLEPLWDKQHFAASSYALQATSLYFTCMANGNSKMYRYGELVGAVEAAGFALREAHHNLGSNAYSLLMFRAVAAGEK